MWGVIPAAGRGSRIQPLAFSKELLPVGSAIDGLTERPRAVSEYLVERMLEGGAEKLCFVVAPGKSDIVDYFGGLSQVPVLFAVQPQPVGLCDALFRALPLIAPDEVLIAGLPDTIWFPSDGFRRLAGEDLSFLLFPVEQPELFDAVVTDPDGRVLEVQVKREDAASEWVWGAFRMSGRVFGELHDLWVRRDRRDEYFGSLVNAFLAEGGRAWGVRGGEAYVDVGTVRGYRLALQLLAERAEDAIAPRWRTPDPALGGAREARGR